MYRSGKQGKNSGYDGLKLKGYHIVLKLSADPCNILLSLKVLDLNGRSGLVKGFNGYCLFT